MSAIPIIFCRIRLSASAKSPPLILSFSPRGEGTLELPAARVLGTPSPLGERAGVRGSSQNHSTGWGITPSERGLGSSPGAALAYGHERRPEGGMRLAGLALIDQREHGLAHRFGAAHGFVGCEAAHRAGDKLHGGCGIDFPMRDEQRARLRVDEG